MAHRIVADCWYRPEDEEMRAISTRDGLQMMRTRGDGPAYYKLHKAHNGRIVYFGADLLEWLAERRVDRTAAA